MSAKVIVKDNTVMFYNQTSSHVSLALRAMGKAIVKEAEPNTPKDKGNLRNDTIVQVLGKRATIQWRKKYAAAQEAGTTRGYPIVNYTTAGTGPHFAENAVMDVIADAEKYFREAKVI